MAASRHIPKALKPALLRTSDAIGRATASLRMEPAFLIVGAQRCGTTTMYRTLAQHPAVLKAVWHKGIHYFDIRYSKGPDWYRSHFPLRIAAQRVERSTGVTAVTFESSPYYMWHPLAPQRYARDLPGVKAIVLLRDPIERAYSAYTHEIARGYETEVFEQALELEPARLEGQVERLVADGTYRSHAHQHQAYVTRGQYVDQLEVLAGALGRQNVHVVDSQEFFTQPEPIHAETLDFLGLPPRGRTVFERHNARPRSPMPDSVRARLDDHFRPHDERLAKWLGKTPSWRR